MRTSILAILLAAGMSSLTVSANAATTAPVVDVLSCVTEQGNKFKVTWDKSNGNVVINHGNYIGQSNTNDMAWNKRASSEAEDTEVYMNNGDVHNTFSVTDYGDGKAVSFKQTVGKDANNIWVYDTCVNPTVINITDDFLENMMYLDDE